MQARGAGRDRRLGGNGFRVEGYLVLPGASEARMWEPAPAVVYAWHKAAVA